MTGLGTSYQLQHEAGKRLTRGQAILAKCADCMGNYVDGRTDCEMPKCPLYTWMPYKGKSRIVDEV